MQTGPGNVKIAPGCRLVIRCSKSFTALGLDHRGELKAILGPRAKEDRLHSCIVPPGINTLKMQTSKLAHWSYEWTDRHAKDELDLTPMEMPVQGPERTYADEMRRIVRDEMSRLADAKGQETFEQADDFDIEEEPLPLSQYEMSDMQEDEAYAPVDPGTGTPVPNENGPPAVEERRPETPAGENMAPKPDSQPPVVPEPPKVAP